MKKRIFLLFIITAFLACPVFGKAVDSDDEDDEYVEMRGLGDQLFSVNAGLFIPLFFMDTKADVTDTNLKLGGVGSLMWQTFISNHFSLGAEFGGMFAFSPNDRVLYMIPLTAKLSYWLRFSHIEIPFSLGLGGCYCSLGDSRHIDFIAKPSLGIYWAFNNEWIFGANATYWWVPQIYNGSGKVSSDHTMYGNFLETSLCVMFRF
ncbi:MAG: hypothetical protein MJ215_02315 [Spirochaetia bacterium]|nr:hypothetical protein [Spirochaetia bacterium]